jgi:hypothetical protein
MHRKLGDSGSEQRDLAKQTIKGLVPGPGEGSTKDQFSDLG